MVAVSAAGPQKRDFSHAGTASTAVRMLRTRRDRMKPGFHLALTRWKSRFTWFTAGQTRPAGASRKCARRLRRAGWPRLTCGRTPNMAAFAQVKAKREDVYLPVPS